jgi:hypothetical protein
MPTGTERFKRKQEAKAASSGSFGPRVDYFGIKDREFALVRFLEQGDDLVFADVHRIPIAGRTVRQDLICLDTNDDGTPCPGCQSSTPEISRRSTKGYLNLIWREGPVYERNDFGSPKKGADNKYIITGRADGIFLWKCSATVFQMLLEKDTAYRGLMSRDLRITRTGSGMQDTKFAVEPADIDAGAQQMTVADQELAAKKYNLAEITKALPWDDFVAVMNGAPVPDGPQPTMSRDALATASNVFQNGGEPLRSSAFTRG